MKDFKHRGANILGNFMISFFTPLLGNGVAQMAISNTLNFEVTILTSLVSAGVVTGLSVGYELKKWSDKYGTR